MIFGVAGLAAYADMAQAPDGSGVARPFLHHGLSALAILAWLPVIEAINAKRRAGRTGHTCWLGLHGISGLGFAAVHMGWTVCVIRLMDGQWLAPDLEAAPYALVREAIVYGLLASLSALAPSGRGDGLSSAVLQLGAGATVTRVPIEEIDAVEAARNYVIVHARGRELIERTTLSSLAGRLPHADFIQLNRSVLVRNAAIRALEPDGARDHAVRLRCGRRYRVSRRRIATVREAVAR